MAFKKLSELHMQMCSKGDTAAEGSCASHKQPDSTVMRSQK